MDNVGFSGMRWDHWLLIFCFLAVAGYGLHLSWQWKRDAKAKRTRQMRIRLARQLQMDQHNTQPARQALSQRPQLQQTYGRKR